MRKNCGHIVEVLTVYLGRCHFSPPNLAWLAGSLILLISYTDHNSNYICVGSHSNSVMKLPLKISIVTLPSIFRKDKYVFLMFEILPFFDLLFESNI